MIGRVRVVVIFAVCAVVSSLGSTASAHPRSFSPFSDIVFQRCDAGRVCSIYRMRGDGTGERQLGEGSRPSWSPNRSKIVFESERDGDLEIFVMNAKGEHVTQLTHNTFPDWDAAWSPTGDQIAFTTERGFGTEIYVMDRTGSSETNLTDNPAPDEMAAWSPTGRSIAFARGGDIYVMDADGGQQEALTSTPTVAEGLPDWSPNGLFIAFCGQRSPTFDNDIFVMTADGSHEFNVTQNADTNDCFPSWSPYGTAIAYARSSLPDQSDEQIYSISIWSPRPVRLTETASSSYPDWGYRPRWQSQAWR